MEQKAPSIFINPKFKSVHINRNFLVGGNKLSGNQISNKIHINPKFLQAPVISHDLVSTPTLPLVNSSAIIKKTKRSLIRASSTSINSSQGHAREKLISKNLIKISNTKLVNATHLIKRQQKENELIKNVTESLIKTKKLQRKTEAANSIYKFDRRREATGSHKKKRKIVSQYSIRRVDTPKKITSTEKSFKPSRTHMLNINGIMYKSTSNKLEKTNAQEKLLIIRGQKFRLDSSGTKLKLDSDNAALNLSRIDIGGVTYKASNKGSYERDNSHQIRSHLTHAKTKSISLLQRGRKTNAICPIYRRLGKCLAYANGRCPKHHDPRYVIVCPKFIKGTCTNDKCLLSHNANLHKMPVCKYYLQGLCSKSKEECLYLHKKLSDGTKLCGDFIKGYCSLADQCNLLHDTPQAEKKRDGRRNMSIVRNRSDLKIKIHQRAEEKDNRYFIEDVSTPETNIPTRSKTAPLLPDFIKI